MNRTHARALAHGTGGDLLSGGATVVQTVAEGLKAAEAIARWLDVR